RQDEMLAVIDETERQRNVELPKLARIEIVNREAPVIDVDSENVAHEVSLPNQLALRIDSQHAPGAAALHFERIETGTGADTQSALAGEIFREADLDRLPGRSRVLGRLADGALRFGLEAVAQIDAVKPRLELGDS